MKAFARSLAGVLLSAAMLASPGIAAADDRPGTFGFSLTIDGEGFFLDPTLKSVTVNAVVGSSPAAAAGLVARDRIVWVDGRPIAGTKASELKPYLKRNAGETVHLRLKRPNGDEYEATLVAAPK